MAKKIYLSGKVGQGKFALVDDEDFDLLSPFKWYLCNGYAARNLLCHESVKKGTVRMHSEITNYARADHKNRNKLDNQKENLRNVTQRENIRNRAMPGVANRLGVTLTSRGVYRVQVETTFYGTYLDAKIAALVADEVKRRKWAGSIFVENFPNERLPDGFKILNLDRTRQVAEKTSKVKYVTWSKSGHWRFSNGQVYKAFKTEEEAIAYSIQN